MKYNPDVYETLTPEQKILADVVKRYIESYISGEFNTPYSEDDTIREGEIKLNQTVGQVVCMALHQHYLRTGNTSPDLEESLGEGDDVLTVIKELQCMFDPFGDCYSFSAPVLKFFEYK